MQGMDRNLGHAVEAKGKANRAYAAVDIELHVAEAEVSHDVLLAHGRKDERTVEGYAYLSAVGVAREHEIDKFAAWVFDNGVRVIGFVNHQDDRTVRFLRDGEIEIRVAGAGVVCPTQPDAGALALDGNVLIDEDGNIFGFERIDNQRCADGNVVIAEDGVGLRCLESREYLGGAVRSVTAGDEGKRTAGNEVSGNEDKVG